MRTVFAQWFRDAFQDPPCHFLHKLIVGGWNPQGSHVSGNLCRDLDASYRLGLLSLLSSQFDEGGCPCWCRASQGYGIGTSCEGSFVALDVEVGWHPSI